MEHINKRIEEITDYISDLIGWYISYNIELIRREYHIK